MQTNAILLIGACFAVGVFGHTILELDPEFTVMFHMTSVTNRIEIEVTAKTTGWVGFGFSQSASFTNADLVIGGVNGTNDDSFYLGDYWSTSGSVVPTYDNQQNWFKNDSLCVQNATHTTMYYYRQLDTGDSSQDLVIPNADIYVLWSYGASDTISLAARQEVYHHQINLVAGGSHGGSAIIHGSVAMILLCFGFYVSRYV